MAERNVTVRLKAVADGGGKAFDEVATKADRAASATEKAAAAQRKLGSDGASAMGPMTSKLDQAAAATNRLASATERAAAASAKAGGAGPSGIGGRTAGPGGSADVGGESTMAMLTKTFAALFIATRALESAFKAAAGTMNALSLPEDVQYRRGGKNMEVLKAIAGPFSGLVEGEQELGEAYYGDPAVQRARRNRLEDIARNDRAKDLREANRQKLGGLGREQADMESRQRAEQYIGERRKAPEYQAALNDEEYGPIAEKQLESERALFIAAEQRNGALKEQEAAQKRLAAAARDVAILEKDKASSPGTFELEKELALQQALKEEARAIADLEATTDRRRQSELSVLEKQNELKKVGTEYLRQQVRSLTEQEKTQRALVQSEHERFQSAKEQFASMSALDKEAAIQAAEQAKTQGFGTLSEEQRNLLDKAKIFEDLKGRSLEKFAAEDATTGRAAALSGMAEKIKVEEAKLENIVAEKAKVQNDIQVKIELDEKAMAEELAKTLGPIIKDVEALLKKAEENAIGRDKEEGFIKKTFSRILGG